MIAEFDIKIRITDQDEIKPERNQWYSVSEPPEESVLVYGLRLNGDIANGYYYSHELKTWYYSHSEGTSKKVYDGEITHWIYNPNTPK
jgi:hypothetical protein